MSFSVQTVGALRAARRWARERDEARGYSISYKRIMLAFLAEFVVIGTSLYGAWMFSQMYGSGNDTAKHMMMLAPISYALIEFCRVPLALFGPDPAIPGYQGVGSHRSGGGDGRHREIHVAIGRNHVSPPVVRGCQEA
jgi:hypothetical protein